MPLDVHTQFTCLGHHLEVKGGGGGIKTDVDFPLFLIKHDTVTINNHALCYTAEACFQGNRVGEKVSIQMEKLRCDSPPL